jgi:hypothetical protein
MKEVKSWDIVKKKVNRLNGKPIFFLIISLKLEISNQ